MTIAMPDEHNKFDGIGTTILAGVFWLPLSICALYLMLTEETENVDREKR